MFGKILAMFRNDRKESRVLDPISAQTTIAVERNARASRNAQEVLDDILADRGAMGKTIISLTRKM